MNPTQFDQLHYPEIPMRMFQTLEQSVLDPLEVEAATILGFANQLKHDFMSAKIALYEAIKNLPENQGKNFYSPMVMTARYHKGSMTIFWQEMHFKTNRDGSKSRYYKSITRVRGVYPIRTLRRLASYDADLVEDSEIKARELRKYWAQLMELKKAVRIALSKLPPGVAAALAEKNARSVNRLIPRSQENSGHPETSGTV